MKAIKGTKDFLMITKFIPLFESLLATKCPRAHPLTEKDEAKVNKRLRTIRNRTVKQRAGMLGLSAVVNAYPYRVPSFVPSILVQVARVVGASKGNLKTTLFSDFRKSKEDGWIIHKRVFTPDQYEFLQEYFLGGNYYA
jgi:proteasome activator subunit 4